MPREGRASKARAQAVVAGVEVGVESAAALGMNQVMMTLLAPSKKENPYIGPFSREEYFRQGKLDKFNVD